MTRWCAGALVALALAAGLAIRLARLDARPMHHDEANQAVKFGALVERGEYRYDAHDHHGPTLYYLTLPAAWLRGQATLPSLDERTLRLVPALFGAGTILLLPLIAGATGRTALVASAWLLALSPAMVFYSRMFIQESLFTAFTLAFVVALGRIAIGGGPGWAMLAGLAAGLAVATKETSVIVLPAACVACVGAWRSLGAARFRNGVTERRWARPLAAATLLAAVVAALFFSSFLSFPAGVLEPLRSAGTYVVRGIDPARHAHPWHYYAGLLTYSASGGLRWSEGVVVGLALVGVMSAFRIPVSARPERAFWTRYVAAYTTMTGAVFSAIPYKTPWNVLPLYVGAIVLAGMGFAWLAGVFRGRAIRLALAAGLVAGTAHLGAQAWRASVTYAADPRNPYAYAQTVPDAVRLATRIRHLAMRHPDGLAMQVSVIASPYEQWPLPWYLRAMPNVGYWTAPGDAIALQAPVLVGALEHAAVLDAALGDGYVSEYFGLRPEVLLSLYVERGLWDRYLGSVAGMQQGAESRSASPATSSHGPVGDNGLESDE